MFSYLWYGAYENLVVSSLGLKRFSLLGFSSSSRAGVSSLGCLISFSRYLVLKLVIYALTVGIFTDLYETFIILRRAERDIIVDIRRS
jgi:hypothetical protein